MTTETRSDGKLRPATYALMGEISNESTFELYKFIANTAAKQHALLLLNSNGGYVENTFGLMVAIMNKFPIFETRNVGECSSAAVDLLLAGTFRTAIPPAIFFTHPMRGGEGLDPGSSKTYAKTMQTQDDWILNQYAARTKKPLKFWREWFKVDRFFDAKEALRLGIIHEIYGMSLE